MQYSSSSHHRILHGVLITLATLRLSHYTTAQDITPTAQKCVIYPVDFDSPSPWYEAESYSDTAISFNLLFDSVNATLHIRADEETSLNPCLVRISKDTHQVDGTCLSDDDIKITPLKIHEDDVWSTLIIRRRGPLLVLYDNTGSTKVLQQNPSATSRVFIHVTSEGPVNTAFDCNNGCLTFGNGIIQTKEALNLSARLVSNETNDNEGLITVVNGVDEQLYAMSKEITFSFSEHSLPEDDEGWKDFLVEPIYVASTTGESYMLTVNGSLIGDLSSLYIGNVPSQDMFLKFENMEHIQWSVNCPHVNARPTMTSTTYVPKARASPSTEDTSPTDGQTDTEKTDTDQTEYDDLLTTNSDWENEIMNSEPSPQSTAAINHETTSTDEEATSENLPSEQAPSEEALFEETPSEEPYSEDLTEDTPDYETYPEPTADDSTVYIPFSEEPHQETSASMELEEEVTALEVEEDIMVEAPAVPKREAHPTPKEELWTLESVSAADRLPKSLWMICLFFLGCILVC